MTPDPAPVMPVARTIDRKATLLPGLALVWLETSWPETTMLLGVTTRSPVAGTPAVAMIPVSGDGARNPPAVIAMLRR